MTKNTYWNEGETASERIDHAEEARRLLGITSATTYEATAVKAQVHATLALVEQHRIANIISVSKMTNNNAEIVSQSGVMDDIGRTLGLY